MSRFLKGAMDVHNKLHEHIFTRRTDLNDVTTPRVGRPVDVTIKFIQGSGLPKMDPGPNSWADPYIIANIDGKASYVSTAQPNTLNPIWNETWMVANVPSDAKLRVDVYDKDEGVIVDDYIGFFTCSLTEGAQVQTLKGVVTGVDRGNVGFQIFLAPAANTTIPKYSFNGPIRYSRHFSPTAGTFIKLNSPDSQVSGLWSTWKISLKGVPQFFEDHHQHWNVNYKAAQTIFQGPLSFTVRVPIQAGHRMLYARTTSSTFGVLEDAGSFWALFRAGDDKLPTDPLKYQEAIENQASGKTEKRIKPAVYTYVIGEDEAFRFSETGASFFVDFASKHALHSCCSETVRYSGEFHPRPVFPDGSGWASFSEDIPDHAVEWELVIDNNSGTYAPDKNLLPKLAALFQFNFPGLRVVALDFKSDEKILDASRTACRQYALTHRGIKPNQLQPSGTVVEQSGSGSLFSVASKKPTQVILGLTGGQSGASTENVSGPGAETNQEQLPATAKENAIPTGEPTRKSTDIVYAEPAFPTLPQTQPEPIVPSTSEHQPQVSSAGPSGAPGDAPPGYDPADYERHPGMPDPKIWRPPPQAW